MLWSMPLTLTHSFSTLSPIRQLKKSGNASFPSLRNFRVHIPGKPLIFQHTIYRERRNFDLATEKNESERMRVVDELMAEAVKRYKDVYYVTTTNATSPKHDTSVDGTHPGDHGYSLWAESIQKPILKILRKYGIR